MNKEEFEIFKGIFKRFKYFELPEINYDPEEAQEILDSYSQLSLPEALESITRKIIRHMEVLPEPNSIYRTKKTAETQ